MSVEYKKKLRDLATRAAKVAELVHQNGDSPSGPGGRMQHKVLVGLRPHGPDPHLEAIEGHARALAKAIRTYLAKAD